MDYNAHAGIDLHIHSNASDGSLSPIEILHRAQALHLRAISITDHDTLEGSKAAAKLTFPDKLQFLTGVEISASPPPSFSVTGSFHILGYAIRVDHEGLNSALAKLQTARRNRNPQILHRLNDLGFQVSLEELQGAFGTSQLGRPHIAQMMVRKGFVKTIDEAFDRFIGKGQPAYVDKYRLSCSEAIQIIQQAGGIAVLAHPFLIKTFKGVSLEAVVASLKEMGLDGLEVYYPDHSPEDTHWYIELANRFGLLMTGGTDFHGDINPDIEMGEGRGSFHVPYSLYETLVRVHAGSGETE